MTKVLVITNKSDLTSDFIIKKLKERHIPFYRFNTEELTKSVFISLNFQQGSYELFDEITNECIDLKKITAVYFRRPELPILDFEELTYGETSFIRSEISFTLEGIYKILKDAYWISPIYAIREAENKIYQLILAESLGLSLPKSIITNSLERADEFFTKNENNCIVKPIKSGLVEDSVESKIVFTNHIKLLPKEKEKIEKCPLFFQNHIEKKADVRVTIVGQKVFTTLISSQTNEITKTDWRKGEILLEHMKLTLPDVLEKKCVLLLKHLGLKFGAIDFILDKDGNYIFLEINPNGQWAWIEMQTGYEISNEIVNLLINENF
jgi:glutathione synthase/RimK-type ligase-like ATP-grasp enzyme